MAKEDEWLQLDRRLGQTLVVVLMTGGIMMLVGAFTAVPVAYVGLALFLSGIVVTGVAAFQISRKHGLGFWRSGFLATKTALRILFYFAP